MAICAVAAIASGACGPEQAEPGLDAHASRTLNDCAPAAFVEVADARGIRVAFGGEIGHNYSPRCLRVGIGAAIRFEGPFETHPLVPGRVEDAIPVDDEGGPIRAVRAGHVAEFVAREPGRFGFYCDDHVAEGMMGALEVISLAGGEAPSP